MRVILDIISSRSSGIWTRRELIGRALWEYFGSIVFKLIPRPFWTLRNLLLRAFGARIGKAVRIFPSVRISVPWNLDVADFVSVGDRVTLYNLGLVSIGHSATISQGAHLCAGTHDFRRADLPLLKLPISIGAGAWICADAFIGPGVEVGPLAVAGARAVVMKNISANEIMAGNPARRIGVREIVSRS